MLDPSRLDFSKGNGLVTVVAQDARTGAVLVIAPADPLSALAATIAARAAETVAPDTAAPEARPSYTRRLLGDRNLRLKKIGEEAAELVTACADGDAARAPEEGADVVYHALVALQALGVTLDDVRAALGRRAAGA